MPNAIAVDSVDRAFYWGDARLDKIERVDMKSLERVALARASPQHPFDIAVFGPFLFYTDWVLHSVVRVNKYTGEDVTWLRKNIPRPMSVIAVGRMNETKSCPSWTDPCVTLNGGCEDLCSVGEDGRASCDCYAERNPLNPDRYASPEESRV
jgi:low-density lipoprotein receptor-related protein 1 (alpha-2-macroglobulin receptor)